MVRPPDIHDHLEPDQSHPIPTWELIERIQKGDKEAGEVLYERYGPRVFRLVRRAMGPRLRAKLASVDLVQSSLRQVFTQIDLGDGSFILMPRLTQVDRLTRALEEEG